MKRCLFCKHFEINHMDSEPYLWDGRCRLQPPQYDRHYNSYVTPKVYALGDWCSHFEGAQEEHPFFEQGSGI